VQRELEHFGTHVSGEINHLHHNYVSAAKYLSQLEQRTIHSAAAVTGTSS
jgi:hypothetical protein